MSYKKITILLVLFILLVTAGYIIKRKYYDPHRRFEKSNEEVHNLIASDLIKEGDIIFQTSISSQCKAIQLATHSIYSHCGIILKNGNEYYVFEAVQPVKFTRLENWIVRGNDGKYVLKRLKNSENILTREILDSMEHLASEYKGKYYDLTFEWSDDKMYCSELVWKIYKITTGLEIGKLQRLKDFDLSNEIVKDKMKERYGEKIPYDEIVISPAAIFDSELLTTIREN